MKALLVYFVFCTFSLYSQKDLFPMKGDFIYYEFKETTSNKNRCIKQYFCMYDSTETLALFQPAYELQNNVKTKCRDLNKYSISGQNPIVLFPALMGSKANDCLGEIPSPSSLCIILPGEVSFLESTLLGSLLNSNKLKVLSQQIKASIKIKFYSKNEYSISFTNFKITYSGKKGNEILNETLDLEAVYKTLLEKGKQSDKMYDRSLEAFTELDNMIKFIAKTYSDELKRIYQIDEL
jgi:hypothetical protein